MTQNGYRQRVVRSCRLMERLHRHVNANARQKNWFDRATASYVIIAQHSLVAATFSIDDLVISFITLKVDYRLLQCCSGRSTTWTECDLDRVQSAVNAAARLTAGARKYDHVTPLLKDLHWLRVQQRVQYKLCVLVHPCLNGTATRCMYDLTVSLGTTARRRLRSVSSADLVVPSTRRSTIGDRALAVASPRAWNSLPPALFVCPLHRTIRSKNI